MARERTPLESAAVEERFVRASGPGGQNVNKVATAVQLRFSLAASNLPADVKARLRGLAGQRLTIDDVVVIDAREARTQAANREAARARLIALIERASVRPKRRRATKPTSASRDRRLTAKRNRSRLKTTRLRQGDEDS